VPGTDESECTYCGARFDSKATSLEAAEPSQKASGGRWLIAVLILLVSAGAVVGFLVTAGQGEEETSAGRAKQRPARSPINYSAPSSKEATLAEEPAVVLSAKFEEQSRTRVARNGLWIYGIVENTSKVAIDKPQIHAIFKDAEGNEIATVNTYGLRPMAPGDRASVRIIASQAPSEFDVLSYEVTPRQLDYAPHEIEMEVVSHLEEKKRSILQISGKVRNPTEQSVRSAQVLIELLDAEGRLVGLQQGLAGRGESIAAGAEARFSVTVVGLAGKPASFRYSATARPASF
jgi:hypothetical protein